MIPFLIKLDDDDDEGFGVSIGAIALNLRGCRVEV